MAASRSKRNVKKNSPDKAADPFGGLGVDEFIAANPELGCEINGHDFFPIEGVVYRHDYRRDTYNFMQHGGDQVEHYRKVICCDLFFILYFILGIKVANHPFVVEVCKEVEKLNEDRSNCKNILWVWAREHFKSSILTTALSIQRILNDPEKTIGIFSWSRPAAKALLREIKGTFENNSMLKICFSDILWQDPQKEAPKWSEDDGIIVKRRSTRKESTVEASGLLEVMPTGKHYDYRVYDDILTVEMVDTPETIQKLKDRFDMSENCGTQEGTADVIGTFYHHQDVLVYVQNLKLPSGELVFHCHKKTATEDGTPNGRPVLLSESRMKRLQANKRTFYSQQLLDPTPQGEQRLNPELLAKVPWDKVPDKLYKFMLVDPAGVRNSDSRAGDRWAIGVLGVEPCLSDVNASRVYLLDLVAEQFSLSDAMKAIGDMYCRHGRILKLGIEKVGMSVMEVHVQAELKGRGRNVTMDNGLLCTVSPEGRKKEVRIGGALEIPLNQGMFHITPGVKQGYLDILVTEMNKFPYWNDDILDMVSYLYDILRDFHFGRVQPSYRARRASSWAKSGPQNSWMVQ